jgi:hypothetical protein
MFDRRSNCKYCSIMTFPQRGNCRIALPHRPC